MTDLAPQFMPRDASGAVLAQTLVEERGSTGLARSGDYLLADFLPQLNGQMAARIYTEMAANDPLLGGILFAFEMLTRRVPMAVAVDDEVAETEAGKAAVALAERMLFRDLETPFATVLEEAASMFTYGYAPCEVVYRVDPVDGLMVRKLALRDQRTITRWMFEPRTGALLGCYQQDYYRDSWSAAFRGEDTRTGDTRTGDVRQDGEARLATEEFIPRWKLALFRTTAKLDNPEGRSLLRTSYTTWMQKRVIEEAEARVALRQAGLVLATVPGRLLSRTASPDERAQLAALRGVIEGIAADRTSAAILPSDVDPETKQPLYGLSFVVADGRRSGDMSPIIERKDARMAGAVLADFMLLGQAATGSFALSKDKTELFTLALFGFIDAICAELNRTVLRTWWRLRGGDPALTPFLVPGSVEEEVLQDIAAFVGAMVSAGVLTADEKLEAHVRRKANLPAHDPATARARPNEQPASDEASDEASDGTAPSAKVARPPKAKGTKAKATAKPAAKPTAKRGR